MIHSVVIRDTGSTAIDILMSPVDDFCVSWECSCAINRASVDLTMRSGELVWILFFLQSQFLLKYHDLSRPFRITGCARVLSVLSSSSQNESCSSCEAIQGSRSTMKERHLYSNDTPSVVL